MHGGSHVPAGVARADARQHRGSDATRRTRRRDGERRHLARGRRSGTDAAAPGIGSLADLLARLSSDRTTGSPARRPPATSSRRTPNCRRWTASPSAPRTPTASRSGPRSAVSIARRRGPDVVHRRRDRHRCAAVVGRLGRGRPSRHRRPRPATHRWAFECTKPGTLGDRLMLDFVFPGGLYAVDSSDGSFDSRAVQVLVEVEAITPMASRSIRAAPRIIRLRTPSPTRRNTTRRYTGSTTGHHAGTLSLPRLARHRQRHRLEHRRPRRVVRPEDARSCGHVRPRSTANTTLVAVRIKATNSIAIARDLAHPLPRAAPCCQSSASGSARVHENPADVFSTSSRRRTARPLRDGAR